MRIHPVGSRPWGDASTVFEQIGGDETVRRLANAFYDSVEATSPVLHDMLPASTVVSRQKLHEFLSGWMGGPPLYWERRGHPALRMRHARFYIDPHAAAEWTRCMTEAIKTCQIDEPAASWLAEELGRVSDMLINQRA